MGWTTTAIRPLGPRVLVKMDPPIESVGGIIIPENLRYQAGASSAFGRHGGTSLGDRFGTCVAVGTGHYLESSKRTVHQPVPIAVGERVVFGMYNGTRLPPPDDDPEGEYWMMTTTPVGTDINPEVWGVLEEGRATP